MADTASARLTADPSAEMTWAPLPLDIYGDLLPEGLKSSWVFVLRRGIVLSEHRHPNSVQRMVSYRGAGDFQTRIGDDWLSHLLTDTAGDPLESRWITIPENVWHRGVMGGEDWVVVSFHTVRAEELIEETPSESGEGMNRRTYAS
ncbi:MAG TPA: hypothetical protein VLB27_06045 [candidate division Zixibacteria bacterium]|nr:hypothetical protein [candidate division Zixibacteria bacterium]